MNRQEFKEKAKKTLDDVFSRIEDLEKKSKSASQKARYEFNEEIAELKIQKAKLEKKYHELEDVGEEQWEKAKSIFKESSESFKKGFEKLGKLVNN
ncbi:MAG: hypothetical protein EA362_00445 [Saprospirales bacterium]|nr:MAG: hypothetical protein EA362_00445 [Saprospirales bacterium]